MIIRLSQSNYCKVYVQMQGSNIHHGLSKRTDKVWSHIAAFVISCFQVTLLHRHPHDTRHWLHTKLLHSLRENRTKWIARLWPNPPTLYLETFTKSDCLIAWVQIYRAGDICQPCGSSSQLGFALPCSTRMYNSTATVTGQTTKIQQDHCQTTA